MNKFAHLSDIHLGSSSDPELGKHELKTFKKAMDECIRCEVDFILVSGDFFHVSVPDLGIVKDTIKIMREVKNAGIPTYVIKGSHDYTYGGTDIIDILHTAGVLTNVVKQKMVDGKLVLDFFKDPKTGAKITGIHARKMGLEKQFYEVLDRETLEKEEGFKIFAFHSGITEFKPEYLASMQTIQLSYFPRNFNYYAGGHIHVRNIHKYPGFENVVYPGPLFTGHGKDIEATAKGEKRGFYLVSFDETVKSIDFVETKTFDSEYFKYDLTGKNSHEASEYIKDHLRNEDVEKKLVVLKVYGELSGGKTYDIDFNKIKTELCDRGAFYVYLNRHGLKSTENSDINIRVSNDASELEHDLFKENIGKVSVSSSDLKEDIGVKLSVQLLKELRKGRQDDELKDHYEKDIVQVGVDTLKLREKFEVV